MSENYKFVQNTKCEFFPCHNTNDSEHFNCLFCYCPLYALKENCGGNFSYKNKIKDCSNCMIPHSKGGYDHVMSKIGAIIEIGKKE
ncbi:cysteine-rich small domain-containing protein [Sporosalibacterium faouarense]|uniref:cysteine-rich small domain-containing protein n=1 Tax=Sporosalibacterium faouarense TaxID=516123 RepID=UPI00141C163D|nr:cysteine-rich small domain-containing protein [Sporosalibacterium faouarense]MTI47457.1 metal-binding protein [Bacillota bacterium]